MSEASSDPYRIYPAREKGIGTRRIIEMVGVSSTALVTASYGWRALGRNLVNNSV